MPSPVFSASARWIWIGRRREPDNTFVAFRRTLNLRRPPREARLRITADARYELFVNGVWIGHGPPRSWHWPWPVDEYDLSPYLTRGGNVIAVLVHHQGINTFQYLLAAPGLLAELKMDGRRIVTDSRWRCARHTGFVHHPVRISVQQAWAEVFDARRDLQGWHEAGYDDRRWSPAVAVRRPGQGEHRTFELRDIPMLTRDPVLPTRLVAVESVRPAPYTWSIWPRRMVVPDEPGAEPLYTSVLAATRIISDRQQPIQILQPHYQWSWKLNGKELKFDDSSIHQTRTPMAHGMLQRGSNLLLCRLPALLHHWFIVLSAWTEHPVRWGLPVGAKARPGDRCPWLQLGPFDATPVESHWNIRVVADPIHPSATGDRFEALWKSGRLEPGDAASPYARPIPDEFLGQDPYAIACSERVVASEPTLLQEPAALLSDSHQWAAVYPSPRGDTRILLDYGKEVIGYHELEIDAPAGAVIDNHNFELIQRDGRKNLAEGMTNAFRYICREGVQRYRTFVRRGFRYSWLSFRNFKRPIRLRRVAALMSTYPLSGRGDFTCSDDRLTAIWRVGAHSVRCCAEDTYTDCPTYEQTHWVGDARNEALVDLVISGDARLSRHCWIQAARSLRHSDLVQSHVPSGWPRVLPAWTFLWMRWAQEHYELSGDRAFAAEALRWLERNYRGLLRYLNRHGLFEITAWNMFDWAPMDTPGSGVVTHQNCLAVLGLRQTAELAGALNRPRLARRWNQTADQLARAINRHLWSDAKGAYVDSIHADGKVSTVFSQQTQTAAYISGVAASGGGDRARRCRAIMDKPPRGFVRAGSPFFMFFLLEALAGEQRFDQMARVIRDYWGPQIDEGATTFWETYCPELERKTRSHCHGWSAAPTYFLSRYVLGVEPIEPGYARIRVAPRLCGLKWAHGIVPTPRGDVTVDWRFERGRLKVDVTAPRGVPLRLVPPVKAKLTLHRY